MKNMIMRKIVLGVVFCTIVCGSRLVYICAPALERDNPTVDCWIYKELRTGEDLHFSKIVAAYKELHKDSPAAADRMVCDYLLSLRMLDKTRAEKKIMRRELLRIREMY